MAKPSQDDLITIDHRDRRPPGRPHRCRASMSLLHACDPSSACEPARRSQAARCSRCGAAGRGIRSSAATPFTRWRSSRGDTTGWRVARPPTWSARRASDRRAWPGRLSRGRRPGTHSDWLTLTRPRRSLNSPDSTSRFDRSVDHAARDRRLVGDRPDGPVRFGVDQLQQHHDVLARQRGHKRPRRTDGRGQAR